MQAHDLLIVGAGPVGLALALSLHDTGLDIVVADARDEDAAAADPRILALAHGSRLTLERLGVWKDLPVTPITTIHVSQEGGFGRTLIQAGDYDVPALGYVVSAGALAQGLRRAVGGAGIPVMNRSEVTGITPRADRAIVDLRVDGDETKPMQCAARLVACAEGGLGAGDPAVVERDYRQHALIGFVGVEGGHCHKAWERFTREGPIALLPCEDRYALVHVTSPETADRLLALDEKDYLLRLQNHFGSRIRLMSASARRRYPLCLRYRRDTVGQRTVWLGNAAQTLHPVAGQGFNLALRDVFALADAVRGPSDDPGSATALEAYSRRRTLDRYATIHLTDGLVRLFSNTLLPLGHLRGMGLFALDVLPPLRDFLAKRMMFGARAWP